MPPAFHPVRPPPPAFVEELYSVADALFTRTPEDEPRVRWAVNELCDLLMRAGARSYRSYRAGLFIVSLLAPLRIRRFGPLRKLSREDRIRALSLFEETAAGAALFGVKSMLCITYYEHPESAKLIGWNTRPLLEKEKISPGAAR